MLSNIFEKLEESGQPGAFSIYDIRLLIPEVMKLKPGEVYLEIGVDRGRSLSLVREVAHKDVHVVGIDIVTTPELNEWLIDRDDVVFIHGDSSEVAKSIDIKPKVLFIDGNHYYDFVKADIDFWADRVKKGGVIFFHDYDESSPGVIKAVNEFAKKHPEYTFIPATTNKTSLAIIKK